jgi:hypothetical protein
MAATSSDTSLPPNVAAVPVPAITTTAAAVAAVATNIGTTKVGGALKIVVGSTNAAKIKACEMVVNQLFPIITINETKHTYVGVAVESGVSNQPKSAVETMTGSFEHTTYHTNEHPKIVCLIDVVCWCGDLGAKNRAAAAQKVHPDADFGTIMTHGMKNS